METKKKSVIVIIAFILVICLLGGMIAMTVVLSRSEKKEWNYTASEQGLDYYSGQNSNLDFQYITNFKRQISSYFGQILGNGLATVFQIDNQLEAFLEKFSERVVTAMAAARIPAEKINKISDRIRTNSFSDVYKKIMEKMNEFRPFESEEDVEKWIIKALMETSVFSLVGSGLNSFMTATTLNENEISDFIYYFAIQNESEEYKEHLLRMGKDYFTKIIADTVYCLCFLEKDGFNRTEDRFYNAQAVLFQLGDLYGKIDAFPNGRELFEQVFRLTWEYDEKYVERETLNAFASEIRGDIATLFVFSGKFLKEISVDELKANQDFRAETDEARKEKMMMISAMKFSSLISSSYGEIASEMNLSEENASDFLLKCSNLIEKMNLLAETLQGDIDEDVIFDDETIELPEELFDEQQNAFKIASDSVLYFAEANYSENDIFNMSKDDVEYENALNAAKGIYSIEGGYTNLFINLARVWFLNKTARQEAKNE